MRGKRGQFFLLAAVIISAVIISFGAGVNKATVNDESEDFYDSSDEIRREIAAYLDYAVFADDPVVGLETFLELLAKNIEGTNPSIDFAFIYGDSNNKNKVYVRNYGSRNITIGGHLIEGREQTLNIMDVGGGIMKPILTDANVDTEPLNLGGSSDYFLVKISEEAEGVSFPRSKHQWVVFVSQKEERGDLYVSIG